MVQTLLPFPNCLNTNYLSQKLRTIKFSFNFLYQLQYKQLEQIKAVMSTFWQEFK